MSDCRKPPKTNAERQADKRKRDKESEHRALLDAIPDGLREALMDIGELPPKDRDCAPIVQAALLMLAAERIEQKRSPDYHPALPPEFVGRLNYAGVFADGVYHSDEAVERALPEVLDKLLDYGLPHLRKDVATGRVKKFPRA